MQTINRSHRRKVAAIKERATTCRVHSLGNGFTGKQCDPQAAWDDLTRYSFARLWQHADGITYTVHVHGNLWYKLTAPPAVEQHDYEPGEGRHPMHTDPLCAVCGQAKH